MLIAKLLGWFKGHQTTTIFVLEILAVFIGITASLLIDDWRQSRDDRIRLRETLVEIHANVLEERVDYQYKAARLTAAAKETGRVAGLGEGIPAANETELAFGLILDEPFYPTQPPGLARLISSDLLGNYPELQKDLDYAFRYLQDQLRNNEKMLEATTNLQVRVLLASGAILAQGDPTTFDHPETQNALEQRWLDVVNVGYSAAGDRSVAEHNSAALHTATNDKDFRALLTTLMSLHIDGATEAWKMEGWANYVVETIEEFDPSIRPRFGEIGLDGTATGKGFSSAGNSLSVPMRRSNDDPDVWVLTADLVAGDLKFRADNSWDFSWGAPTTYRNISSRGGRWAFAGDPDDVFPQGTSELRGLDIPVRAGRYDVTFNSRTLEYSFRPTDGSDQ